MIFASILLYPVSFAIIQSRMNDLIASEPTTKPVGMA